MQTATKNWDTFQNLVVTRYAITKDHGVKLAVLSWGATLHTLSVPTANGEKNLVLSYHRMTDYLDNPFYVGMSIGRTGGVPSGTSPFHQLPHAPACTLQCWHLLSSQVLCCPQIISTGHPAPRALPVPAGQHQNLLFHECRPKTVLFVSYAS